MTDLEAIEQSCIKALDKLGYLSAGVNLDSQLYDLGMTPDDVNRYFRLVEDEYKVVIPLREAGTIATPRHLAESINGLRRKGSSQ